MNSALGQLRSVVLNVDDMDKACLFYQHTLGLTLQFRDGERWASFDAGGITIALAGGSERANNPISLNFKVPDVELAVGRAVQGGASLVSGPTDGRHEIRATVQDIAGHELHFYKSKPKS